MNKDWKAYKYNELQNIINNNWYYMSNNLINVINENDTDIISNYNVLNINKFIDSDNPIDNINFNNIKNIN